MCEQRADMLALALCSFAPGLFGLELFEQRIEALIVLFEDFPVVFDPVHGLIQSFGFQSAGTPLRIAANRNESGALEHFQVLGDGGLAHLEGLGELHHRRFPGREPCEDGAASRVGEGGEGEVEALRWLHNCPAL